MDLNAVRNAPGYVIKQRIVDGLRLIEGANTVGSRDALIDYVRNVLTPEQRVTGGFERGAQPNQEDEEQAPPQEERQDYPAENSVVTDKDLEIMLLKSEIAALEREKKAATSAETIIMCDQTIFLLQPDVFTVPMMEAIDAAGPDETLKRSLLQSMLTKKTSAGITAVSIRFAKGLGLPSLSSEVIHSLITGEYSKFSLEDLLSLSPLRNSLPLMEKDSSRYRQCMKIMVGYTGLFFPAFAARLRQFSEKFIEKDNGTTTWSSLLRMEPQYRNIVTASMSGPVNFSSDEFAILQFNLMVKSASDKMNAAEGHTGARGREDKTRRRPCFKWNDMDPSAPLDSACPRGFSCQFDHECSNLGCQEKMQHRRSACYQGKQMGDTRDKQGGRKKKRARFTDKPVEEGDV